MRRLLRKGPQLQPGEFLHEGRYRLVETLGKGGFATVWKAYDRQRKKLVAVKVLHGQHSDERMRWERFFRGARKMADLSHTNIVRVLEAECKDDGWLFFVMELVVGGDFGEVVLAGALTDDEKLAIISQMGEALEFAHQQGIIHRDVKPANILLDGNGVAKLTDFDLVRTEDSTGFTQTRAMLGTLNYAAPEALESPKDAGPPADVYSLASTAVFALLGKPLPRAYYRDPGPAIASLACPPALARVLTQATAADPEQRFASASAFITAIKEAKVVAKAPVAEVRPIAYAAPEALSRAETRTRRRVGLWRRAWVGVSVVALMILGWAGWKLSPLYLGTLGPPVGTSPPLMATEPAPPPPPEVSVEDSGDPGLLNITTPESHEKVAEADTALTNDAKPVPANPGELNFSRSSYRVNEDDGTAVVTVRRVGGSDGPVSAFCRTIDDTAEAGVDYIPAVDPLTWINGDKEDKLCTISIQGDAEDEPEETIRLSLAELTGGATVGRLATAALIIIDDPDDILPLAVVGRSDNVSITEQPGVGGPAHTMSLLMSYAVLDDREHKYQILLDRRDALQGAVSQLEVKVWNTRRCLLFNENNFAQRRSPLIAWKSDQRMMNYVATGQVESYGPTLRERISNSTTKNGVIPYPLLETRTVDDDVIGKAYKVLAPVVVSQRNFKPAGADGYAVMLSPLDENIRSEIALEVSGTGISAAGAVVTEVWVLARSDFYEEAIILDKDLLRGVVNFFNALSDPSLEVTALQEAVHRLSGGQELDGGSVQEFLEKRLGIEFSTDFLSFKVSDLTALDPPGLSDLQGQIHDAKVILAYYLEEREYKDEDVDIWVRVSDLP